MPFSDIRNIYFEKFTDKNHCMVIVVEFYEPKSARKLIPNKETVSNLTLSE